jgi:hypothetical protein
MPGFALLALRIAVVAGLLLTAGASALLAQERVGVNSAVNPEASGAPPGATARRLVIGQNVVFNEHITTAATGQTQLLFLDESSMTVGPNSDLTIDQFVYDPKTGTGKLAMSATRGLLRYVGGKLSKQDEAVTLRTATATLAVRGGAFISEIDVSGKVDSVFLYGKGLTITGSAGGSQTVTRPGFSSITIPGGSPSSPGPAPAGLLTHFTQQLDGRTGSTGGAKNIPTDANVVDSGISQTVSDNVTQNVQQAAANQGDTQPALPPSLMPTTVPLQNAANQPDQLAAGSNGTGGSTSSTTTSAPYGGFYKTTPGTGSSRGFVSNSSDFNIPYTGGQIGADGFYTADLNGSTIKFPVAANGGSLSFGTSGTDSPFGPISGTSFITADRTFLYANSMEHEIGLPDEHSFVYGGIPVNASFYTATGSPRIFAFNVQPDAALQSNIPFIRDEAGGNLSNPTVSPFYVLAPATSAFASYNGTTNTVGGGRSLQASLAINGTGTSQSSVLVIDTGSFITAADSGKPAGTSIVRGSFLANGTSPLVRIGGNASTLPDAAGNTLFGGDSISGFVLDQGFYDLSLNRQTSTSSEIPYGGTTTSYGFAQPVTATTVPSGVGTSRTSQTLTGYFGGIMYPRTGSTAGSPYAVTGTTSIKTNAPNGSLTSTFTGSDPFGTNTVVLQFGFTPNVAGTRLSSTFIDDSNFSAVENQFTASQVNGTNIQLNGDPTQASRIALVSSGVVPTSSLLPNGLCSSCQFLQWGYWTGELDTPNSAGTGFSRNDRAHINTWVAGIPTSVTDINTLTGTAVIGTYTGNALGSVVNNGASYLAAGGFTGTYNFGTQSGSVTLSNFDGHTFSATGSAPLTGANYNFTVAQTGVAGKVNGTFYGAMAKETGGSFAVQSTLGPSYVASGIFAGRR